MPVKKKVTKKKVTKKTSKVKTKKKVEVKKKTPAKKKQPIKKIPKKKVVKKVVKKIVTPLFFKLEIFFHKLFLSSTSTPAVGSSKKRIFGSCDKAFAIKTLLFIPPDNVLI